jgi:hypothetical protein
MQFVGGKNPLLNQQPTQAIILFYSCALQMAK